MQKVKNALSWLGNFIKKHKKISLVLFIIIALISFFILKPKNPQPVITEQVKTGEITKSVSATGKIEAESSVNLTFQAGGKLTYLGVKKGDSVSAGQTIAILDQSTVERTLKAALLDYSKQRNTFEQALDTYNVQSVNEAQTEAIKRILENNQFDLDKSVNSVELQDIVKQNSILTTPISGVVTRADITTAGVNVGITTTFTVTDPNSISFNMEIDEADIGSIKEGQAIDVSLDAFPDEIIHLSVDQIDFASHTTTSGGNAFTVKAKISSLGNYRIGMNGNADVILQKKTDVLLIPVSSIVDQNFVYVKENNKFVKKNVVLGLQNDTSAEVKSGLSAGEFVAVDPSSIPQDLIQK